MAANNAPDEAKRARDRAVHEAEMRRLDAEIDYALAQIRAGELPESAQDALDEAQRSTDEKHRRATLKALNEALKSVVMPAKDGTERADDDYGQLV